MNQYEHVFTPIKIGDLELRNRVYIPPHGMHLTAPGPSAHMVPSVEYAAYFRERAANGVGLIMHSMTVMRGGTHPIDSPADARAIPSFKAVVDGVHAEGCKMFAELWYVWMHYPWQPASPGQPMMGPSSVQPSDSFHVTRAINKREIRHLIDLFARAAENLKEAGYDGITLHVAHAALPAQFLSPYFNHRDDEYGGTVSGRMRFVVETLERIREAAGGLPVGMRFTANERLPGGLDIPQSAEILRRLKRDGLIDFVDLDFSVEPQQVHVLVTSDFVEPLKHQSEDVGALRETGALEDLVVLAAGRRVTTVAQMEHMVASGIVDVIGCVRGFMAEPELLTNALEGREDRSRVCLSCNQQWGIGGGFTCVINPAVGREARWGTKSFTRATEQKKVVVIGGGPAGLEAARVCAKRGHEVVLLERRPYVGGLMKAKANLPGRTVYQQQIDWWERQARELGVDLRLSSEATPAVIAAMRPDVVFVATGSVYDRAGASGWNVNPIPGADLPHVYGAEDVLLHGHRPRGTVLIFDGEGISTGPGIAELLCADGARCVLVTPGMPGAALTEGPDVMARIGRLDVELLPQTYLCSIGSGEVMLAPVLRDSESLLAARMVGDGAKRQGIDVVVLASMRKPADPKLELELEDTAAAVYVIGDALAPRDLRAATYEAQYFGRLVGEPGAPSSTSEAMFRPVGEDSITTVGPADTLLAGGSSLRR